MPAGRWPAQTAVIAARDTPGATSRGQNGPVGSRNTPQDPHAPRAAMPPQTRKPGVVYERDEIKLWCCTAELTEDGWQHERSCPARLAAVRQQAPAS